MIIAFDVHLIKLISFILFSIPIMISSITRGTISNKLNLLYLIGGILMHIYENKQFSYQDAVQMLMSLALATIVMKGLVAIGEIGGRGAKFFVATIPWFSTWEYAAIIVVIGFLLVPELLIRHLIGRPTRNGIQYAPRMIVLGGLIIGSEVLGR